jgi:hypothetical protein
MKSIIATIITPVWRCPVKAGIWRGNPYTRNPIITIGIVISPIPGLP